MLSAGYHNLKLDRKSLYLSPFSCPFDWYRYIGLPFRVALEGDMFLKKIDEYLSICQMILALLMTFELQASMSKGKTM